MTVHSIPPYGTERTGIPLFAVQIRYVSEHSVDAETSLIKPKMVLGVPGQLHHWDIPWQGVADPVAEIQPHLPGPWNAL